MNYPINDIISLISSQRFDLTKEKITQKQMHNLFLNKGIPFLRHYPLDNSKNIPDFFYPLDGTAIEVKIKGDKAAIYKQCERYCGFNQVKALILCTNKSVGFPGQINGKPCYFINLGKAWL